MTPTVRSIAIVTLLFGSAWASAESVLDIIPQEAAVAFAIRSVHDLKVRADKFVKDGASRGDLKLVSVALRELRYSFKIFAGLKHRRKVTVFGSARTPPSDPTYQAAMEFGRLMAEHGYLVVTGAAQGIMEAGHAGAGRENSVGINILLPFEQSANTIIAGDVKLWKTSVTICDR